MRNFFLIVFLFCILKNVAQCPTAPITLASQADVNAFPTNYPGCTEIPDGADLVIMGNDITDLTPLLQLTSCLAPVEIRDCSNLTNLNGLNNITTLGNDPLDGFILRDLPALTDITALNNLITVTGEFTIRTCGQLTTLNGLNNLSTVNGSVIIRDNVLLQNFLGLNGLVYIGETLEIVENPVLTDISALSNVNTIIGGAEGGVFIDNNSNLTNLNGLGNDTTTIGSNLDIFGNGSLSICGVPSICNYLSNPPMGAIITINTNLTGCDSETEINNACVLSNTAFENNASLVVYPTIFNSILTIKQDAETELTLWNVMGQNERIKVSSGINKVDLSHLSNGLYFIGTKNNFYKIIKN